MNFIIRNQFDMDNEIKKEEKMAMTPRRLRLLIVGLLVMIAGYILLAGGGSKDPNVFNWAMFNFQRLYAAPVVILCGIAIEIIAIMGSSRKKESKEEK
jgi:cytochrome bd-type quinol oxidase subunit 2